MSIAHVQKSALKAFFTYQNKVTHLWVQKEKDDHAWLIDTDTWHSTKPSEHAYLRLALKYSTQGLNGHQPSL